MYWLIFHGKVWVGSVCKGAARVTFAPVEMRHLCVAVCVWACSSGEMALIVKASMLFSLPPATEGGKQFSAVILYQAHKEPPALFGIVQRKPEQFRHCIYLKVRPLKKERTPSASLKRESQRDRETESGAFIVAEVSCCAIKRQWDLFLAV